MEDLGPIMTRGKISMENQVQERTRAEACPLQKTGQAMEAREMLGRSQSPAARFQTWFRDGRSLLLRPQEIERRSSVPQPVFYRGTMILAVSGQQEKGRSCQGMNKPVRIDGDGDFGPAAWRYGTQSADEHGTRLHRSELCKPGQDRPGPFTLKVVCK